MESKLFLGIDLGTSSLKLLLADGSGKIVTSEKCDYGISYPFEGWSEQDPDDWLNALIICLSRLQRKCDLKDIEGISFCGQMHGLVILDNEDRVIRPTILWNDNRTMEECAYLNEAVGKDKLIEYTGNIAFAGFTAPKLLWLKKYEPQHFARIAKIMLPKDYLAYRLTGVFASDITDNSGTLYFDVHKREWSLPMLKILGITEAQLPRIFDSFECIGTVCTEFQARTGLRDAKVVIGGGDQAVGAVGTGTIDNHCMSISLGTSGTVFASLDQSRQPCEGIHLFRHANGKFHLMGCILSAAASINWWQEILKERSIEPLLDRLNDVDSGGLLFLPYLMGERSPINDSKAKGIFFGLNLSVTSEQMTKAVIEGICFALKDCYLEMLKSGLMAPFARVIGGGANSKDWMQILCDVLNLPLRTINTADGGSLGAIMLAMKGCGYVESLGEAADKLIRDNTFYQPHPEKARAYDVKFQKYQALYAQTKNLME